MLFFIIKTKNEKVANTCNNISEAFHISGNSNIKIISGLQFRKCKSDVPDISDLN